MFFVSESIDSWNLSVLSEVNDIDQIVKVVRFDGWQTSEAGECEVKKSLRKALLKYKLHKDNTLFERAYAYIKEYY